MTKNGNPLPPEKQWPFLTGFLHSLRVSSQRQIVHHGGHSETYYHTQNSASEDKDQDGEECQLLCHYDALAANDHVQNPLFPGCSYCCGWEAILPEKITSCHKKTNQENKINNIIFL